MKYCLVFLFLFCSIFGNAQSHTITIDHKPIPVEFYKIIIPKAPTDYERQAAKELQKYLERLIGTRLIIASDSVSTMPWEFVLGNCLGRTFPPGMKQIDPDGFCIKIKGERIYLTGGSHKGILYGVYEFLEKYCGCRFYAPDAEQVSETEDIILPAINQTGIPAFRSREVYYAGMSDPVFANKMRIDRNAWKGAEDWGMWVHTMFTLVPPDKYFDPHPEYYALMAGKRGKTQLCLTNPDVLKVTIEELGRKMKEKPEAKYWSVSQMDTYGYCECDACQAINRKEGAPSGSMIAFVNKVAAAFPDKVISTLAYQYTRKAPKQIRPASNVNIMLCTIECDRNKPIDSDTSTGSFYCDLRDWSRISNDILVWDYVIQFTNMLAPFPNLHVLQPNIRLFKKFNATAVFEQGCHGTYSENQELRQYLLAKLLWNPDLNIDSLQNEFIRGYYGNASGDIKKYVKLMQQSQIKSGKSLWIYGSPVQETGSFLGPDQVSQYDQFFNDAEYSVSLDPELLVRVKMARLPLRYAKLEIARKNIIGPDGFLEKIDGKWMIRPAFTDQLNTFTEQANAFGVKSLHERGLTPDKYKEELLSAGKDAYTEHLALNKSYTLKNLPDPKYMADGPGSLTDGKRGFSNYHILWQGVEGNDFEMVLDMGEPVEFNYLGAEFLQDITSWIFMPEQVQFFVSENGKEYREVAKIVNTTSPHEILPVARLYDQEIPLVKGRYIKVVAKSIRVCPEWHIGHGGKSWVFVDEITVQKHPLP